MQKVSRRHFFKTAGSAALVGAAIPAPGLVLAATKPEPMEMGHASNSAHGDMEPAVRGAPYTFFNPIEAAFVEAAIARLIPTDERCPGAYETDVAIYIDRQLSGAWGAGERFYSTGPWLQGARTQGYQLPFAPGEFFRRALAAVRRHSVQEGTEFDLRSVDDQDSWLKRLEANELDLDGIPSRMFFDQLLQLTVEGFFADPIYGGNKDMASWRAIGFPGANASYYDELDSHGVKIVRAPVSIGS
jgi:gluconate 2-dehydrogenase gamma chain